MAKVHGFFLSLPMFVFLLVVVQQKLDNDRSQLNSRTYN